MAALLASRLLNLIKYSGSSTDSTNTGFQMLRGQATHSIFKIMLLAVIWVTASSAKATDDLKLGMIQPLVRPGSFKHNLMAFLPKAKELAAQGAQVIVLPEGLLPGYPSNDWLNNRDYIDRSEKAYEVVLEASKNIDAVLVFGHIVRNRRPSGKSLENVVSVVKNGKLLYRQVKILLPTYGPFDDQRYFAEGDTKDMKLVEINGRRVGFLICEDSWWRVSKNTQGNPLYKKNPVRKMKALKPDLVIVVQASPYHRGKQDFRQKEVFGDLARYVGAPVVAVNQVAAVDQLLFDGASMITGIDGNLVFKMRDFEEDAAIVNIPKNPRRKISVPFDPHRAQSVPNELDLMEKAITFGTREFVHQIGHDSVVFGLSGGLDSTMTAYFAVQALGAENVSVILMPNDGISSDGSISDSMKLIKSLGIPESNVYLLPIHPLIEAFRETLVKAGFEMDFLEKLKMGSVAMECAQARVRMLFEFFVSNLQGRPENLREGLSADETSLIQTKLSSMDPKWRGLFSKKRAKLATADKSELAINNGTFLGDVAGVYAPVGDAYKTDLWNMGYRVNERSGREVIPLTVLEKEPSPELVKGQLTTDRFPPYRLIDPILIDLVENDMTPDELREKYRGFDALVQARHRAPTLVDFIIQAHASGEWKREMMQFLIPKLRSVTFGKERRVLTSTRKYDPVPDAAAFCDDLIGRLAEVPAGP